MATTNGQQNRTRHAVDGRSCRATAASLAFIMLAVAGCQGNGDVATDDADSTIADSAAASNAEPANAGTISAPQRIRDLPEVDARAAARQVALMPAVTDRATAGRIALLAEVFRLAIESDAGANDHYLLIAGGGVELESVDLDAHEFAIRTLAPLGILSIRDDTHIAWASADVQERVRQRLAKNSDPSTEPIRVHFPGSRSIASLMIMSISSDPAEDQVRGTVTIEAPDGRMARQGFEATRDGPRFANIRLTGVRVEW